jgi:tetratricopeptide (TPR) repeat protein
MSLLMDALKKAELAKRQGIGDSAGTGNEGDDVPGLALEPLSDNTFIQPESGEPTGRVEPTLSLATHLEELDAQFLEEAAAAARQVPPPSIATERLETSPSPPPPPPPPAINDDPIPRPAAVIDAPVRRNAPDSDADAQVKAAAQNLFAAKQPEKQESRKGFAIAIGLLTVLSVAGIGGYFWWQLQPKGAMIAKPALPPPPATQPPAPAPTMAAVSPAPTPAAASAAMSAASPPAGQSGTAGTIKPPMPAKAAADDLDDDDLATASSRAARSRRTAARIEPEDDSPIRVTREPLRVDPAINRGFEAFNRGELTMAQLEYERARKTDPRNPDILHGLAAIALRQGRYDQAEAYYRQVLESDPQDSVALAALLNQRGQIDPGRHREPPEIPGRIAAGFGRTTFFAGQPVCAPGALGRCTAGLFPCLQRRAGQPRHTIQPGHQPGTLASEQACCAVLRAGDRRGANRPAGFDRAQARRD